MKSFKLDSRYTGSDLFKYGIEFNRNEELKFCEVREWCWKNFGPSCEIDIFRKHKEYNEWAWIKDPYRTRIYFVTEKEYQWFLLKWGNK